MPLHRFVIGSGFDQYVFPSTLGAYNDNFGDAVTRTTRLPGVDGGFDEYLAEAAAREIGTVRQSFTLQSDTKAGLDAMKDELNEILRWGKGYLYMRPSNYPTDVERRVAARVANINMPKNEGDARDLYWQRVTVIWQCNHPVWEAGGSESEVTINHSGTSTSETVNNGGNAIALPRVTITCGASDVMTGPIYVRRMFGPMGMTILDEVTYAYSLTNNTELVIDANEWSVTYDDGAEQDAYDSTFDFDHPDWLRLLPGDNSIDVVSGDAGDSATVKVAYRDSWY